MLELRPNDIFAGCRIISLCGKGGFGSVYLATDATGKRVAVKLVNTNNMEQELQGIRNYLPVSHQSPHLLSVYHVGIEQNELFLIMEAADPLPGVADYLPDTLARRLKQHGRIAPEEALEMIRQISCAIKTLHDAKLLHRDIKPDNVIFVNGQPKLADPGLICSTERTVTLAGTLGFLPPECFSGAEYNSMQSDIYALGKLFYCIITGEAPGRFPHFPRDLSFSLCRKLLPVLMHACNTHKKKRYDSITDFQRNLPRKLPRPGWLFRCSEKFRIWRLMHCRLWYGILTGCLALLVLGSVLGWSLHRQAILHQQKIAAYKLERKAFEEKFNSGGDYLAMQLERLTGKAEAAAWSRKIADLPADPAAAANLCRQYTQELNGLAMRAADSNKAIPDAMKRAAAKRAMLKSPLGAFLTASQRESLQTECAGDEAAHQDSLNPWLKLEKNYSADGSGMYTFVYIPPGEYRSPYTGELKHIDYPFWVAPAKLSFLHFSMLCMFLPSQSTNLSAPAGRFMWNDLLYGCEQQHSGFIHTTNYSPGYILRPLTDEEWSYCASRGMNLPDGQPNDFGLYGLGGKVNEMVCSDTFRHADAVLLRTGDPKRPSREIVFNQIYMNTAGVRLAIAPGSEDFYDKAHRRSTPQQVEHNGMHYEYFGHTHVNMDRQLAQYYCDFLGGRLASLDSPELLEKINRAASPVIYYNNCVGADFRDGKWYWANGKPVQNAPPPPAENERFQLTGTTFKKGPSIGYMGFVCEWTAGEYRNRGNWQERIPDVLLHAAFTIDGKKYAVFKMALAYPHMFKRFAEVIGGRLAEPETPELRQKISEAMGGFAESPTLLGGYWKSNRHYWYTSGNQIKEPLQLVGRIIDAAPSLTVPVLHKGELQSVQICDQFLVEFPARDEVR